MGPITKKKKNSHNESNDAARNTGKTTRNSQLNDYLQEVKIKYGEVQTMSKKEIKQRIRNWDNIKWREELEEKTSVRIYKNFKPQIKNDGCYDNSFSSNLLFKARSNTLKLKYINRHTNGSISCDLCGNEKEDIVHFLLDCKELDRARDKNVLKEYYDPDKESMVGKILHSKDDIEKVKTMIEHMWNLRKNLM